MHSRPPLYRRRPSAPLVISSLALFVALGGVGWAATQLPAHSVGTRQLQRGAVGSAQLKFRAVTNSKLASHAVAANDIRRGAIGRAEVNSRQVQLRVTESCGGAGAIQAITRTGGVSCSKPGPPPTGLPDEFGASSGPVGVSGASATTIVTKSLPAGSSYLVLAEPFVTITGGADDQKATVICELAVGGANTVRGWTTEFGTGHPELQNSIPLTLAAGKLSSATNATVSCASDASTTTVVASVNAIQTASNG